MIPCILAYHKIVDKIDPGARHRLAISKAHFDRQMKYLDRCGYKTISLDTCNNPAFVNGFAKQKYIILTFDDGYQDFICNALPILDRYHFKATVFVVIDRVGKTTCWQGEEGSALMGWDELNYIKQRGTEIGSHTCSHRRLVTLNERDCLDEFSRSRRVLEDRLNSCILSVAYPYGESNLMVQDAAKKARYALACGVDLGKPHRFNLHRVMHSGAGFFNFMVQVSAPYRTYRLARVWLREDTAAGRFIKMAKTIVRQSFLGLKS